MKTWLYMPNLGNVWCPHFENQTRIEIPNNVRVVGRRVVEETWNDGMACLLPFEEPCQIRGERAEHGRS